MGSLESVPETTKGAYLPVYIRKDSPLTSPYLGYAFPCLARLLSLPPSTSPLSRRYTSRTATGRAQRASARNQNGAATATEPPVSNEVGANPFVPPASADSDYTMIVDEEPSQLSRSNSSQNLIDSTSQSQSTNGRTTRRKDKGKGKEIETSVVRIKEEPKLFSLHTPEPLANQVSVTRLLACFELNFFSDCQ